MHYKKKLYENIKGVPIAPCFILDDSEVVNKTHPIPGLVSGNHYVFLAEISQAPGHFVVFDLTQGKTLRGMYELYRFKVADPDEDM